MKTILKVLRRKDPDQKAWWQEMIFETEDENASVATALTAICADPSFQDTKGQPVGEIVWDCSCLQKKCGACAMVINGRPRLACDTPLREFKGGPVTLEPLRKFPVVADLAVDRGILYENLKTMKVWYEEAVRAEGPMLDLAYASSRCLQCGCCLEVCPNFYAGGTFAGTAALGPTVRLLASLPEGQKKEVRKAYRDHIYEGCGKSLACRNICPAGIDVDELLVNANAMAVWKRLFGPKGRS